MPFFRFSHKGHWLKNGDTKYIKELHKYVKFEFKVAKVVKLSKTGHGVANYTHVEATVCNGE